jgi:hypothetical protein
VKKIFLATAAVLSLTTAAHADMYTPDELSVLSSGVAPSCMPKAMPSNPTQLERALPVCKEIVRKEVERRRAQEETKKKEAATREWVAQEAEKQRAIQRARTEEAERQQREWWSKPENRLVVAYDLFHRVQFCRQVRDGYLVVNISEPEYERATTAVKAVERAVLTESPDLNTDAVWVQGEQRMKQGGFTAYSQTCKAALNDLFRMSPAPVYQYQKP